MRVISGTFLIAGTMIGAGMLGIPLVTGASGFLPGILVTTIVWFFMYCTGLLFLEVTLWMPDGSNVLSIAHRFLGKGGRLFSGAMFIFLYYCLMIAYFAAGAPLLAEGFSAFGITFTGWEMFALFGVVFGAVVAIGPKSIDRVNIMMSIAMIAAWFVLIGSGAEDVKTERLTSTKWSSMLFAMPVLFSAFGFHNVIPSLCTYLKRDKRALRFALFWGSLLPLIVYIVWQWLIIGAVPQETIAQALREGVPITTAFQSVTGETLFIRVGSFFAFFAIVTSTLGVAFSMVDFLGDGFRLKERTGLKRLGLTLLTFIPPFTLAALNPDIFTTALGVAGGFGEAFLNGLLPIGLLWIGKYSYKLKADLTWLENKGVLALLTVYTLFVIAIEFKIVFMSS
ncbi:amino acid permease [Candidatus Neptunochlamydia vexilliferae]|uniref:Tyrosine-specific transport protein 1 n=1 Tax=Candidatus Neptunichlamydia vexilliferae TaxID=1651774 RepID=A0ABS0AXS0_9BACT|nr:aromatic amino acid transport family protein [Candidatus Neptunochlamydia vexilliferae]MBF5058764.1 Tyrosine-specific transport protein 1 [Candidatus Neptunochlamydia vexilliferae]